MTSGSKLAVLGASSMVGSRFVELSENDFSIIQADLNGPISVDITDKSAIKNLFDKQAFQHIGILSLEFHVDKLSRPLL